MSSPKVWLITGTSSGLGRRLVSIVLARGDRVIATAKTLASISHFLEVSAVEKHIHCAELDISFGTEQVKKKIDAIIRASGWGTVDVLVNNAGMGIPGFVEEGGSALMRYHYQTNVCGTLDVTMAVLPYMRKQKSGTVVMIGSRSGWRMEMKGIAFYGSSKAALHGKVRLILGKDDYADTLLSAIAETMAVELEPLGIRMLIAEPGAFRTEGINRNDFHSSHEIPDYDDVREATASGYKAQAGKQRGDPVKAMKALVEVVCGEGRAREKPWPLYLVLGKDTDQDVRNKCARMISHLDEWSDIIRDVDLDDLD